MQFIHRQVYYYMEPQSQQLHIIKKIKNRQKRRRFYLRQEKLLHTAYHTVKAGKVTRLRVAMLAALLTKGGRGVALMMVVATKTMRWALNFHDFFFCYCVYYIPPQYGCERTNSTQKSAKLFRISFVSGSHFYLHCSTIYYM